MPAMNVYFAAMDLHKGPTKNFGSIAISVGEKNLNFTNNSNLHKLIFI